MILVLIGTSDKKFTRLLKAIDKQIEDKRITDKVIVQQGHNNYKTKNMEMFDFLSKDELNELVKKADIIVTHGGVGSIIGALENKKIVIAAARKKEYGEAASDHQEQIIKEFVKRGYILELEDFNKLDEVLEKAKNFKPKTYKSNNANFIKLLDKYIEEKDNVSWYNKYRNILLLGLPGIVLSIINIFVFYILKYNYLINVIISFMTTFILSLIINKLIDIKINKKYLINKILNFIFDISFMYLLVSIFSLDKIVSKIITNIFICVLLYIIIKINNRSKSNENSNNNIKL